MLNKKTENFIVESVSRLLIMSDQLLLEDGLSQKEIWDTVEGSIKKMIYTDGGRDYLVEKLENVVKDYDEYPDVYEEMVKLIGISHVKSLIGILKKYCGSQLLKCVDTGEEDDDDDDGEED